MFVRTSACSLMPFYRGRACRKQLVLVLGKLSRALPRIFKSVSCVLAHLSRGLFLLGLVESKYICEEPEAPSGPSHMGVSEEMSESSLTPQPTHVKWLCSPKNN